MSGVSASTMAAGLFAASTAASLASAAIGGASDTNQYNRQVKAINAEGDAINRSTIFKYAMSGLQQQQIQNKASVDVQNEELQGQAAKGTATAAAATAGVEGNSVNALLNSFDAATGHNISTIYASRDNEVGQSLQEEKGFQMDAKNRMIGLNNQLPQDPSLAIVGRFLTAGLQVGKSYIDNTTKSPDGSGVFGRRFS